MDSQYEMTLWKIWYTTNLDFKSCSTRKKRKDCGQSNKERKEGKEKKRNDRKKRKHRKKGKSMRKRKIKEKNE